jgi:hypothetical protein
VSACATVSARQHKLCLHSACTLPALCPGRPPPARPHPPRGTPPRQLAITYLHLGDATNRTSVYIMGSVIAGCALPTFGLGVDRYYKVKRALELPQPEQGFNRIGIRSLVFIFGFIFVAIVLSYWTVTARDQSTQETPVN